MRIEITGNFDEVDKKFQRIIEGLKTIPIKQAADLIRTDIENNLNKQKSYDGSTIAPLKPSYKEYKKKHGYPLDIFKKEGVLVRSTRTKRMGKDWYRVYIADARANIMRYLQEGKPPLAGARRAFGVSKEVLGKIKQLMENWGNKIIAS